MEGKSNNVIAENVPKGAINFIKKNNVKVNIKNRGGGSKVKYSKPQYLNIHQGYDFLENLIVVRKYIQKKHNINFALLEMLLYLGPKNVFTFDDYRLMSKEFRYNRIQNILDSGYVKIIFEGKNKTKHLYGMTATGKNIVGQFYELLSGERRIPEYSQQNPMAVKKAIAYDKIKMDMIKRINQMDVKDHMKSLF